MKNVALAACLPQLAQENTWQGKISEVSLLTNLNSKEDFQRAIFNPSSHQETLITVYIIYNCLIIYNFHFIPLWARGK